MKSKVLKNLGLLVLACATGIFIGCASVTAYKSLATLGQTTDAAYRTYNDLLVHGTVKTNDYPAIAHAYNEFQSAYYQAIVFAQYNTNTTASATVQAAADKLLSIIATAEAQGGK
jgi:hypothetical protein